MMKTQISLTLFLVALSAFGAEPETPLEALPYTPSLDVKAMDRSADPCVDFYQYACGGWMRANPLPSDQSAWSVYGKVYQDNQRFLWGILDRLARETKNRDATQQKIGDYFAACMDEARLEKLGMRPLQPYLDRIAQLKSKKAIAPLLADLHRSLPGTGAFFGFTARQDFADATQVIAFANAAGLGLPDRDYYTKDDARSQEIRAKYVAHVGRTFGLLGETPETAAKHAATVMEIETALAKASLTRVERRDPYNLFHKMDGVALRALTPQFDWDGYFKALQLQHLEVFNVTQPDFYREVERQLSGHSLDELKTYMRWHAASAAAPLLSRGFVDENFDFYGRTLRGTPEIRPRWKRCVSLVDNQLGEALGKEFVRRVFGPEVKEKALHMTRRIEDAMAADIRDLDWMTPATKEKALEKLATIVNKIGYPDKWRDYSSVAVRRDDFFGNVVRAERFETKRQLAKIGKPLERGEWFMTPPTVNAYYNGQMNDINFPAGILQPPLFDPKIDDAPNYGDTGGTIGHELTHGFDDQGRKFDANGNLKDWWTKEDDAKFKERSECIVEQFGQYVIVDDTRINSRLTLGEDIADLGGLILAWMAWKTDTADKALEPREGLTPEQRFFVGNAQWACQNIRPEEQRVRAITDPHSPAKYRVNGLFANMPQFEKAFSCKPGQPLAPEKRCRVW